MKRLVFSLLISLSGLAYSDQKAAFSTADLDEKSSLNLTSESLILEAPTTLVDNDFSLEKISVSTTLQGKSYADKEVWGSACNITDNLSDSNYSNERSWTINLVNLETGGSEKLFTSTRKRKIQSVACTPFDGEVNVLFSMKESASGDYEVYQLAPNAQPPFIKLTDNDTDDVDVTSSWDRSTFAWQSRLADSRQAIQLITFDRLNIEVNVKSLASASPFVQPSLSRNGKWLTFVQLRPSFFAVMRYDIENNQYKEVRKVPRRKKLFHPSISDDGNVIGWSEGKNQTRYLVKNIEENTTTEVVNNQWGVEHGYLSAGGDMLIYSINNEGNGRYQTLITDLDTLATSRVGNLQQSPQRYLATSWLGSSIRPATLSDYSGQVYVSAYELLPVVLAFDASGLGQDISNPYEYAYSGDYVNGFEWQVSTDGKLVIDYDSVIDPYDDETGIITATVNYQKDNLYNLHAIGSEQDQSLIADFKKLKTLSLDVLDGKVLKGVDQEGCAISIKIDGSSAVTKFNCGSGIEASEATLSEHSTLDNIIVSTATEIDPWSSTGEFEVNYFGLVDGELAEGGIFKLVQVKEGNQNPTGGISFLELSLAEQEVLPISSGELVLSLGGSYPESSRSGISKVSTLDTGTIINSFSVDAELDGYGNSSTISGGIRLIYPSATQTDGDLTDAIFASMMIKQSGEGDKVMIPLIGKCLNSDCSSESFAYAPDARETQINWDDGFGRYSKYFLAFDELTQVFTFKFNNYSFNMGLSKFYSELGLPNNPLSSENAFGEIQATYRNVNSRNDFAYVFFPTDAAYVNGDLYDDFETDDGLKWDASGAK